MFSGIILGLLIGCPVGFLTAGLLMVVTDRDK